MRVGRHTVAGKLTACLHHEITPAQLVDWAENALRDGPFAPRDATVLSALIARLGLADVRAFGLTWDDCEQFLQQLGYAAHVEIGLEGVGARVATAGEKPTK